MKRFATLCTFLLLAACAGATTTTLTGSIKDAQGNPLNGTLIMSLPVPAIDTTTNTAVMQGPVFFRVVNGAVTGGAALYDTATMQPQGLYYRARGYDAMGNLMFYGNYVVTGASFNMGAAIPTSVTTSNISYLNPATTNGNNTFTGTNIFSNGVQVNVSGTGCGKALYLLNTDATPTSPNKYFRINQTTGALELVNSLCNSVLLSIADNGAITNSSVFGPTFGGTITAPSLASVAGLGIIVFGSQAASPNGTATLQGGRDSTSLANIKGLDAIVTGGNSSGAGGFIGGAVQLLGGAAGVGCFGSPPCPGPINTNTIFGLYNNIATAGDTQGIASEYAAVELIGQNANIGGTTLYAVPAVSGIQYTSFYYRVSCYVVVTTVAGVSSTLPSCVIGWTDKDNATVETFTLTPTNAGNLLTTFQQATMVLSAKASTNITFSTTGYASNGAGIMQYAIHIRLEAL
jgi:hypothetical protein